MVASYYCVNFQVPKTLLQVNDWRAFFYINTVGDISPSCMCVSTLVVLLSFSSKVLVQSAFLAFVIPYPASGFFLFLHLNLNINECNVAVKNKDIIANLYKDYYDWIYRIKLWKRMKVRGTFCFLKVVRVASRCRKHRDVSQLHQFTKWKRIAVRTSKIQHWLSIEDFLSMDIRKLF